MKAINLFFLIMLIGIFFLAACSLDVDDDTRYIEGKGPLVNQLIKVDTFSNIIHGSFGSLIVETGDSFRIEIKAQQNIINEMSFFVEDDIFFWGIEGDVNITDADTILLNMFIPVPLEQFLLSGLGNAIIKGPDQDRVSLSQQGLGNINAYDLTVGDAEVYLAGSGNIMVNVSDTLTGLLSGSGNIYYKGNPVVDLPIFGVGNVIDDN